MVVKQKATHHRQNPHTVGTMIGSTPDGTQDIDYESSRDNAWVKK